MEIREVRSLVLLSESGSIRQTADSMHLTAAAIHKQLKLLGEKLGVRLYEKAGPGLRMTPAAEVVLPHLRNLLAAEEAARNALDEWKGLRKGLVRIGAGRTIASDILPYMLKRFRRSHSSISLFVETGHTQHLIDRLAQGVLDLAVLMFPELAEQENFAVETTWDAEIVLISNLPHLPAHCSLAELAKTPFILFQRGALIENLIERYFSELHFRPRVVMRFDDSEAIKAMVRSSLGISMLPYWGVHNDLKRGALKLIRQKERKLTAKVALVSRQHAGGSPPAQAFIAMARKFDSCGLRLAPH